MEIKDILTACFAAAAFVLSVLTFVVKRNDDKRKEQYEDAAEVEIAHLTEGSTLRRDLHAMLKEANERIDKIENLLIKANARINELSATVNDLTLEKKILESEKKMLQQDLDRREQLFEQQMHSKDKEIESLQKRVGELEREVGQIKTSS